MGARCTKGLLLALALFASSAARADDADTPPRDAAPGAPAAQAHRADRVEVGLDTLGLVGPMGSGATASTAGLVDASVVYRAHEPFMIGAFGTFGAGTSTFSNGSQFTGPSGGDVQVAVGEAVLGVDSRYVEVDAGAGVALFRVGYDVAPTFAARGRFGRRDRFDFTWHFSVAFYRGAAQLGVLGAAMQFRIGPGWWLALDGEFGNLRYGRGLVDLRHRLRGWGSHGTLDLEMGAGVAVVTSSASCDVPCGAFDAPVTWQGTSASYVGPALSVGALYRL